MILRKYGRSGSVFRLGKQGGLCDHWDFRPGRTVRFHNRYGWPFLEIRCRPGSVCPTGRPSAPDPVPDLWSCPQVSLGGLGSSARPTDAKRPHARCSVISGQLTGNAEKVLPSRGRADAPAANSPVPSTLPRNPTGSSTSCQQRPGHRPARQKCVVNGQVLPAGSCSSNHDDDALNSVSFSTVAPGRGNAAGHSVPQAGLPDRAGWQSSHRPGVWVRLHPGGAGRQQQTGHHRPSGRASASRPRCRRRC
jgi:hypothetical protein